MIGAAARYHLAWRFLSVVFRAPPSAAFLEGLAAAKPASTWPLGSDRAETRTGLRLLAAFCSAWNPSQIEDLEAEFNRLFAGPGLPLAPPWESWYRSPDRLLFQRHTLAVRRFYLRCGFQTRQDSGEPDDALDLEMDFVAELFDHLAAEDHDAPLRALRRFFRQHLLHWAPHCLARVLENARLDFYRAAALLAVGCLEESSAFLGLPGGLPGPRP